MAVLSESCSHVRKHCVRQLYFMSLGYARHGGQQATPPIPRGYWLPYGISDRGEHVQQALIPRLNLGVAVPAENAPYRHRPAKINATLSPVAHVSCLTHFKLPFGPHIPGQPSLALPVPDPDSRGDLCLAISRRKPTLPFTFCESFAMNKSIIFSSPLFQRQELCANHG